MAPLSLSVNGAILALHIGIYAFGLDQLTLNGVSIDLLMLKIEEANIKLHTS